MATLTDIATVIHSALTEIGVTGELDVRMEGERHAGRMGVPGGDAVRVRVVVEDMDGLAHH